MQKQTPFIVTIIIGLVLTAYGGHIFLNIKAGHNQATGSKDQPVIQVGLSVEQTIPTKPVWTLSNQTTAWDLSVQNLDTARFGPTLSTEPGNGQMGAGHFFIAGIILDTQNVEERTRFSGDDQPQLVNAGNVYLSSSDLAIN